MEKLARRPQNWNLVPEDRRIWADTDAAALDSDEISATWDRVADPAARTPAQDPVIAAIISRRQRRGEDMPDVDLDTPRRVHLVLASYVGWSPSVEPIDPDAIAALKREPGRCSVCCGADLAMPTGGKVVCAACLRSNVDHLLTLGEMPCATSQR